MYREIRIENKLTDEDGNPVKLKEGAPVQVRAEAEPDAAAITKNKKS